jgi:hypothetical protein
MEYLGYTYTNIFCYFSDILCIKASVLFFVVFFFNFTKSGKTTPSTTLQG